jgi:cytochrome P450
MYNLYCLAANPTAQARLYEEIRDKVKGEITAEVLEDMPYLKACVKEAFRY